MRARHVVHDAPRRARSPSSLGDLAGSARAACRSRVGVGSGVLERVAELGHGRFAACRVCARLASARSSLGLLLERVRAASAAARAAPAVLRDSARQSARRRRSATSRRRRRWIAGFREAHDEEEHHADHEIQPERRQVARAPAVEELAREEAGPRRAGTTSVRHRRESACVMLSNASRGEMRDRVDVRFVPLAAGRAVLAGQRRAAVGAHQRQRLRRLRRTNYRNGWRAHRLRFRRPGQAAMEVARRSARLRRGLRLRAELVRLEVVDVDEVHHLAVVVAQRSPPRSRR